MQFFLSGVEIEKLYRTAYACGYRRFLTSFFYIRLLRRHGFLARVQDEHPDTEWFLDSGAFTFHQKGSRLIDPHDYVDEYLHFVKWNGHRYKFIAEPDIEGTVHEGREVTEEDVDAWREQLFDMSPDLNVMPVWHARRGPQAWHKYLSDPRVRAVAIGSGSGDTKDMIRMVVDALKVGKHVHGFAMTKLNTVLKYTPFSSVDSVTPTTGQRYGILYVFHGSVFQVIKAHEKDQRRKFLKYFERIGCDPRKILEDDVQEVLKANLLAWKHATDRLEFVREHQGRLFPGVPIGELPKLDTARVFPSGERDPSAQVPVHLPMGEVPELRPQRPDSDMTRLTFTTAPRYELPEPKDPRPEGDPELSPLTPYRHVVPRPGMRKRPRNA